MPRIIAGVAGGRRIDAPPGRGTRPTADRTREALFATVLTLLDLQGAHVLDLFAGSGALGLEACSRGAASAVLIESDRRAAATIRANIAALGLDGVAVRVDSVARALGRGRGPADAPADLVLADPPYATEETEIESVLSTLRTGWLADGALIVLERPSRGPGPRWPLGLDPVKSRRYGEATLWYGRAS